MQVHVVTAHFYDERWIDVQARFLRRFMPMPYKVWASLEGVSEELSSRFNVIVPSIGSHAGKLNLLAAEVASHAVEEDLLLFLDGDAFPISDPVSPFLDRIVEGKDALVAVQRLENHNDRQPHPCFALCTVGTWREIGGDWTEGYPWTNASGCKVSDVGGNLLRCLERHEKTWIPLLRSNGSEIHPVFFAIYGGIVYHHGAGFRPAITRADQINLPLSRSWTIFDGFRRRLFKRMVERPIIRRNAALSERVYRRIIQDERFFETVNG